MKYNLPTVYDDYIIKWSLKHRIVLSIEKLWQKLLLEWYSRRAVLIGWVQNSLDVFVALCYNRNRAFRSIWWLIQLIYCNIKVPSVKNGSTKCAWGRKSELFVKEDSAVATVCEVLAVCPVLGGAELSLKSTTFFSAALLKECCNC